MAKSRVEIPRRSSTAGQVASPSPWHRRVAGGGRVQWADLRRAASSTLHSRGARLGSTGATRAIGQCPPGAGGQDLDPSLGFAAVGEQQATFRGPDDAQSHVQGIERVEVERISRSRRRWRDLAPPRSRFCHAVHHQFGRGSHSAPADSRARIPGASALARRPAIAAGSSFKQRSVRHQGPLSAATVWVAGSERQG